MTPGSDGIARTAGPAAARGALLVAVAIIIGVLLLSRGFGDGADAKSGEGGLTITESSTTTTTEPLQSENAGEASPTESVPTVSVPIVPLRPPNEVKVLVANSTANREPGVAGRARDDLIALGYNALAPENGNPVAQTVVHFAEGWEAEATAVAESLGGSAANIAPMPTPLPAPIEDLRTATILVLLSDDLAKTG